MPRRPLQNFLLGEWEILRQMCRDELAGWPLSKEVAQFRGPLRTLSSGTLPASLGRRRGIQRLLWVMNSETAQYADGAGTFSVLAYLTKTEIFAVRGWRATASTIIVPSCLDRSAKRQTMFSGRMVGRCVADGQKLSLSQRFTCKAL